MARRRSRKKTQIGFPGILLFLLLAVVCTAAIYFASRQFVEQRRQASPAAPPAATSPAAAAERPAARQPLPAPENAPAPQPRIDPHTGGPALPRSEPEPPRPARPAPPEGARVAVVIDDLGRSLRDLAALADLGIPVTYSVLPFESRTPEVVGELRREGREILVHLPMEAENGANPGPGALRRAMGRRELVRRTREALAAVPGAVGVNNHMGSTFSADSKAMRPVLEVIVEQGLFFLDSRTSAQTVGYSLASSLGIPAAERQVFLDRDPNPEAVRGEFRRLLAVARERGSGIAIGHPHAATLAILAEEVPAARALGYEFVPVSYLLTRSGDLPE